MKKPVSTTRSIDWVVLTIVVVMVLFGVLIVFDASYAHALQNFADVYHFAKLQAGWVLVGLTSLLMTLIIPLQWFKHLSKTLFIIAYILLIAVLFPFISHEINGARRWLNVGGISLQPSELMKLSLVLYLPQWLSKSKKTVPFLVLMGSVLVLLIAEPDMGTALIISAIIGSIFFLSGIPIKKIAATIIIGVLALLLLVFSSPYRRARVTTYLNPGNDPLGSSYHIRQVLLSIGSGGIFGTGIGRSRQKYQYIPEVTTDSIFAVIAEEMGIWGALATIFGFTVISYRGWNTVKSLKDKYSRLVAAGVIMWISTQAIINLSAMVALIPLTGVPLPFISYGGSSLVMMLTAIGLYLNASRHKT